MVAFVIVAVRTRLPGLESFGKGRVERDKLAASAGAQETAMSLNAKSWRIRRFRGESGEQAGFNWAERVLGRVGIGNTQQRLT